MMFVVLRIVFLLFLASACSTFAAVHYVDVNRTGATPPYTTWATAAASIQDAVDAAAPGDEIVVTNGLYATGGRAVGTNLLVNRVAVDKPLTLRSVNGPQSTIIQGYQLPGTTNGDGAIRCVYLAGGASLSGFTLTNGATRSVEDHGPYDAGPDSAGGGAWAESTSARIFNCLVTGNSSYLSGGGVWDGTLESCRIVGNSARVWGGGTAKSTLITCTLTGNSAGGGGGAWNGTLNNCLLTGNTASGYGGGVLGDLGVASLNNCTLVGNSAPHGGGVANGDYGGAFLTNCVVYYNSGANYGEFTTLNYCCTIGPPEPWHGGNNLTNAPLFVDAAAGNYRPRSDSPCINAGLNACAPGPTDLDGRPRIAHGTVDIGAYEFPAPTPGSWTRKANMPMAFDAHASCEVEGILYVIGGHKNPGVYTQLPTLFAYDPKTDAWTRKADMPTARRWPAACVVDGIIYVIGGGGMFSPDLNAVEAYDPKTDTWVAKAPLATARSGVLVGAVDGIIYAIGGATGISGDLQVLTKVEAYDPKTDQWTAKTRMPFGAAWGAASVVNGLVYAFFDKDTTAYDPKTDRWTRKASIPFSSLRCLAASISAADGMVYLFGGEISASAGSYDLSLTYDPVHNKFAAKRKMPMKCEAAAAATIDGKIYHTGGASGDPGSYPGAVYYDSLWVFDPQGGVAPQILTLTREIPDRVRLTWQGEAGRLYGVESKLNLVTGPWARVIFSTGTNSILATNALVEAICTVPVADPKRFFRVIEAN